MMIIMTMIVMMIMIDKKMATLGLKRGPSRNYI
jgi:hypothetical protein